MLFDLPVVISFSFYIIVMVIIGIYFYQKTLNLSDYFLGGRKLGSVVTALSAGASDMSSWLLLGLPGAFFAGGLTNVWLVIGLIIGAYLNWEFIAKRLRIYTQLAGDAITLSDFLSKRFEDKTHLLRLISAIIILLFFTLYVSSGLVGGAKLFSATFHLSYDMALYSGAYVIIAYTFLGGYQAVSWTDLIQALLMMLALSIVPAVIYFNITSESSTQLDISEYPFLNQKGENLLNIIPKGGFIAIISLMAWGLGYFGQPHILMRFMSINKPAQLKRSKHIAMGWMTVSMIGASLTGFLGIAYFQSNGLHLADGEKIFISLVQAIFNPWIAGILLAAILAAIMSTVDSQLLVASSALTADLYNRYLRRNASEKELVWISRIAVIIISIIALILAGDKDSKILSIVAYAWAGFGASFGPVLILSLFWKRMTKFGAITGLITGAASVIIWKEYIAEYINIYELLPAFIISFLSIVIVSLIDSKPSKTIVDNFDDFEKEIKE